MTRPTDENSNRHRQTIYKALWLAKSTDGTDVDAAIAAIQACRAMASDKEFPQYVDIIECNNWRPQ